MPRQVKDFLSKVNRFRVDVHVAVLRLLVLAAEFEPTLARRPPLRGSFGSFDHEVVLAVTVVNVEIVVVPSGQKTVAVAADSAFKLVKDAIVFVPDAGSRQRAERGVRGVR